MVLMNEFIFNGQKSSDYGIYISGSGTFDFPERDIEKVSVEGRNGDLIIDNGRFKNISLTYPAFIRQNFKKNVDGARMWLLADSGYHKLEDTYHPEIFRMARFSSPTNFTTRFLNLSGECELVFDCKPQRFLKSGNVPIESTGKITLINPTIYEALPIIRVYGSSGTLMVGNNIIQLPKINEYMDIDSEIQNAYKGTVNCNSDMIGDFPSLKAGETGISFEGNIDRIQIVPRWWFA